MTAGVFIVHDNCIEIFSDGGAYDDAGRLGEYSNKARMIPHLSAFVFAAGEGNSTRLAKDSLSHCRSFDHMVDTMWKKTERSSLQAALIYGDPINMRVVIGGYSERDQQWQLWTCAISRFPNGELYEEEPTKLGNFYSNAFPTDETLAKFDFGTVEDFKWDYTLDCGIRFMESIRSEPQRMNSQNDLEGCRCGAFIEHGFVQQDKAYSEIVHRWPDEFGEVMGREAA